MLCYKNILVILCLVDFFGAIAQDTAKNSGEIAMNLNASYTALSNLAEYVCRDLQIYQYESKSFTVSSCQENVLNHTSDPTVSPPRMQVSCQFQYNIRYRLSPAVEPGWRLVVLLPEDGDVDFINYDLRTSNEEFGEVSTSPPGNYTVWVTALNSNGSHTVWRRIQRIGVWNETGNVYKKEYKIDVNLTHVYKNDSTIKALFSWKTEDDNDKCFDVMSSCNGDIRTDRIWPNQKHYWSVEELPLDANCQMQVAGKHGTTRFTYKTLSCENFYSCIDLSMARNVTIDAEPSSGAGWDVVVRWAAPVRPPSRYNITLHSEHVRRTMFVPKNATKAVFNDIEDKGFYHVSIVSIVGKKGIHTSRRAVFPVTMGTDTTSLIMLGGWSAALIAAAALVTAFVCWRRRRAANLKRFYFPDPEDKPSKSGACEALEAECGSEDSWEVRPEKLLLHEVVGEGAFGVVRRGTLAPAAKEVAVKMLKDFPSLEEIRAFRAEMELMKSVGAHPHVVSLVGCCSGRRPLIVAEYCSRGDLLSYLRCSWDVMVSKRNAKYYNNNIESSDYRNDLFKCKFQRKHSKLVVNKLYDLQGICDTELTSRDLLSFCRQIAMGMEFLASNRVVHRDLAARNILVSGDRTLKIADFGLSRDVYEENQYKQKGNGKMPVKWMALESLTRRIYTTQSDVWSFGVVVWEIVTVGATPYPEVAAARLLRLLRAGYRMPRPNNCSKQLYEVMLSCWHAAPRARPTFAELHAKLDELLNSACAHEYLTLELDDEHVGAHIPASNTASHKYVKMIIRDKLGWSRESYERPFRTPHSNHYSSPPASLAKQHLQPQPA
ncbi:tyrosine-protein kinase receptor torso-like [Galleria mellonella]|uniref:Tyrosine-protein kinase receptor torso-like n=1 Tax=Galleria mellonella TaxID=7137 RepID=A0A6J3BWK5_GALME|nr:tyrosine-protein kinase receptor torso-like [Galleria mellonella]